MIDDIKRIEAESTKLITRANCILNKQKNRKLIQANNWINKYKYKLDDYIHYHLVEVELYEPIESEDDLDIGILTRVNYLIDDIEQYQKYFKLIDTSDLDRAVKHLVDYKVYLIDLLEEGI